ncbi:hypothetical protein Ancab_023281, partial [Ancistrocladus abbreviatus]
NMVDLDCKKALPEAASSSFKSKGKGWIVEGNSSAMPVVEDKGNQELIQDKSRARMGANPNGEYNGFGESNEKRKLGGSENQLGDFVMYGSCIIGLGFQGSSKRKNHYRSRK